MLLDYPVARPPPPTHTHTEASGMLSSGRTSQVALGGLPGAKDKGQASLWVRLTLHHTHLQFGTREGAGGGHGPRSAGGQEGLRTALLRRGRSRTEGHGRPRGTWRFLLGLVAGAFAAVSHGCCVLCVEAEAAGTCVKDISCHRMWG